MAIQGFFTGDVKIRDLNGVLKAVNGIVEVAADAGTVTSVGLAVGSTGTDVNVANSPITTSGSITLNLPTASATNRGLLSSADWTTFNSKQAALTLTTTGNNGSATLISGTLNIPTYTLAGLGGISLTSLSASSPLLYNNTTGAFSIQVANGSQNGYLSSTDWTTFNSKQSALTFSAPLVNTSGTISIPAATSSVNGYLTSTDWSTFNSKQGTITLTTTGSSGAATLVGVTLNIPNYGSALTGYVPYTGATGAVNLGAFDLTVQTLTIGKGNSSLSNNTALGYRTLFHITTGNYNTAVGYEAAHNTTTGQYNTALGQSALFTNTTGSQNTALGLNALLNNTTGGSNVVVGLDALQHNTTGSSNTVLGYNAGSHITGGSTPNTTASSSVYIGRDTKAKIDGGTNEIVIGYNAIGNGSNTATFGNTSTTANYFTGSINGGSFVKIGGTSSQFLKADGSVDSSTYYLASNPSAFIALTSLSATAPLSYSNTTGVFSISQATTSTDGYLSSTDWNTFYNKQTAGSYITALTGEATASGPGSASVTLSTSAVTGKLLTGLNLAGGGTIAATDSILQAFGKVQNQISGMVGGVTFQGTWDASTNTPTLTSSVGTKGYYYIVSVAGSTNLNGITDWKIGDWAIFNGTTWDKVDNTDAVSSVNGFTGAVSLTTSNIAEGTNLYYLDSRARLALSFTAGSGAYDNTTGVITIPTNTSQLTNGANYITLSSLSASSPLAYNSGTGAFSIQVATGAQNGYLSSTDWTTFNSKQNTITLTTTGSSGSSTLVGATLNVPTYTLSGLGGVPTTRTLTINGTAYDLSADRSWSVGTHTGSLTSGYIPKATGTTSLTDSLVYDAGTAVLIGTTTASSGKFMVYSTTADNHYQAIGSAPSFRFADTIASPNYTGIIGLATATNNFIIGAAAGDMVLSNNTTSAIGNFLFGTGATERMRINASTGNISINNTNNTYKLDVTGTGRFTGQLRLESTITDGTYTYTLPSATGTLALTSALSGMITGSGTTNYLPKFTGASTIGDSIITDNGYYAGFNFAGSGSLGGQNFGVDSVGAFQNNLGSFGYRWLVNNGTNELMRLNASGNLSIGNTNDTYKLDVSGTGRFIGLAQDAIQTIFTLYGYNAANQAKALYFTLTGSTPVWTLTTGAVGTDAGINILPNGNAGLSIAYTGAATFSGKVFLNTTTAYTSELNVQAIAANRPAIKAGYGGVTGNGYWLLGDNYTTDESLMAIGIDYSSGGLVLGSALAPSTTTSGAFISTQAQFGGYGAAIRLGTSGEIVFYNGTQNSVIAAGSAKTASVALTIAQTGAATFSSSVTATTGLTVGSLGSGSDAIITLATNASGAPRTIYYKASTATINFTGTGGTDLMTLTNGGSLGIGTTSPAEKLDVIGGAVAAGNGTIRTGITYSSLGLIGTFTNHDLGVITNGSERMRITSGGYLLLGTTTATYGQAGRGTFEMNGSTDNITVQKVGGSLANYIYSDATKTELYSTNFLQVSVNGAERMRITSGGNVGINTTSPSYLLDVNGTARFGSAIVASLGTGLVYSSSGTLTSTNPSDQRLKNNIQSISYGLNEILKLNPVTFDWKEDKINQGKQYGFIAQEVQKIMPDLVKNLGIKDYLGLDKEAIFTILVRAIQELNDKIK